MVSFVSIYFAPFTASKKKGTSGKGAGTKSSFMIKHSRIFSHDGWKPFPSNRFVKKKTSAKV
jgi:hypothetical protein